MRYQNYHTITFSERLTIEAMVKEGKKKTEISRIKRALQSTPN